MNSYRYQVALTAKSEIAIVREVMVTVTTDTAITPDIAARHAQSVMASPSRWKVTSVETSNGVYTLLPN